MGDRLASSGDNQTLIERSDGSGWSVVTSPNQTTKSNGLNSVSVAAGEGWAVGYALQPGWTCRPLALHWDGKHLEQHAGSRHGDAA